MARRLLLCVALLASLVAVAPAEANPSTGLSELRTDASRPYRVFVPSGPPRPGRMLVVALHGCSQNSLNFAIGSRWTQLAEAHDVVVLFPEQVVAANLLNCWNWFDPAQQQRDGAEPKAIADLTSRIIREHKIDARRVYVTGVSAGADMTAVLGATYPDLFAAIAPFAGCAYATCADVTGALAYGAMPDGAERLVPAMVVQGTADAVNNLAMGETLIRQQVGTADHADDGALNLSVGPQPSSSQEFAAVEANTTDLCVRDSNYPCFAGATGWASYPYRVDTYTSSVTGRPVVEVWTIHGLSHNYPNGKVEPGVTSFVDPSGPDITTAMYEFFLRNPRP